MKRFTPILVFIFLSFAATAQITFDWSPQAVTGEDYNLKAMNITDDTTAVLVGFGHTFLNSKDRGLTWENAPLIKPEFDFGDLSINSAGKGYACSGDPKVQDNLSSYSEPDVYTDGALLYTSDFGQTWELVNITEIGSGDDPNFNPNADGCYNRHFYAVDVLDDNTVFLSLQWKYYDGATKTSSSKAAVLKTTNGTEWTAITSDGKYPLAIESGTTTIMFGGNNHLYKTEVGSDVVTDIYPNLVAANKDDGIFTNDIVFVNEDEIYIVSSIDSLYLTTDQGETFTQMKNGAPAGGNDMIVIDDNTFLVLGATGKSKLTLDGGQSWSDFAPPVTCYEIGGILNDSVIGLSISGIYKAAVSDVKAGVNKWLAQEIKEDERMHKMHIIDDNNAVLVGYAQTIVTTSDKGLTWTPKATFDLMVYGTDYDFNSVSTVGKTSYASTNRAYAVDLPHDSPYSDIFAHGLIFKSNDNWQTWSILNPENIGSGSDPSDNPNLEGCYALSPTTVACVNDSTVFAYMTYLDTVAGYANKVIHSHVYKTDDSGDSWTSITEDFGSKYVNDILFLDKDNVILAGNTIFLKTTDGGATFSDLLPALIACPDAPSDGEVYINDFEYIDENEWYVVSGSDGVYATYDAGVNYKKLGTLAGGNSLYKHNDSTYVVLGAKTKTKISWDYGENWTDCNVGESIWAIGGVLNDSLVGLAKGEIWKIALTDLNVRESGADILTFDLDAQTEAATIDPEALTININVSTGTDVTALTPAITISDEATISPALDTPQDFSSQVVYTVKSEDQKTTNQWTVTVTVGVNVNDEMAKSILAYPNPARDILFLNNIAKVDKVSVMSVTGSTILSMATPSDRAEINLDTFKNGIYIIVFLDEEGTIVTKRFVKE